MNLSINKPIYAKIIARAWSDDSFRAAFLRDPTKVAKDSGMTLPEDAIVTVVESGAGFLVDTSGPHPKLELALPPRPDDLADEALLEPAGSNAYTPCRGLGCSAA